MWKKNTVPRPLFQCRCDSERSLKGLSQVGDYLYIPNVYSKSIYFIDFRKTCSLLHSGSRACIRKYFGDNAIVCVCNSTYCDTQDPVSLPPLGQFVMYESSKSGNRLERREGYFQKQTTKPGISRTEVSGLQIPSPQSEGLAAGEGSGETIPPQRIDGQDLI